MCVPLGYEHVGNSCADNLLQRLLVLKGPAGSGKTTTVTLLSKALNFHISDWRNPTVTETGVASFSSQFDDFLSRGGAFGTLDFSKAFGQPESAHNPTHADAQKRVLLVEEFPSTMALSSSALASFRRILLQYLAAAVLPRSALLEQSNSHLASHPPIVLVISESLLTSATSSTDSFTAHRLLGPELCNHPYATVLEFNPVAPTLIVKALELAIKKEARISKRRRIPGPAVIKRLADLGDVRSAINGLEFLCVRAEADSDWGGRTAAKVKRSGKSNSSLTNMEKQSLELVTQREAQLGIFHAVGKVVWNKREDPRVSDPEAEPPPKPPDHLSFFDRQKVSQVNTDELFNETGTDIPTFLAALHENYVLSANGSHFPDVASECIDFLSDSDLLSPGSGHMSGSSRSKHGRRGTAMQAGGMEMLRQNEISFQVGVKGLLFSLPSPVNRAPHPNGKKGDSFKMFYPASLKMWKPREEIHDLISLQMSHFLSPSLSDGLDFTGTSTRTEGVESWKSRSFFFQPAVDDNEVHDDDSPPRIWTTRDEALLDRLPYLARINNKSSRDIKRITQFNGSVLLSSGDDEEADGDNSAADVAVDLSAADETTDRVAPPSPQKSTNITSHSAPTAIFTAIPSFDPAKEVRMEKLYISEDDIEDG